MVNFTKMNYWKALRIAVFIIILSWVVINIINPTRIPWFVTRSHVLRITPIGTSMSDVRDVVDGIHNWRIVSSSYERGFMRTRLNGNPIFVGDQFVRANVNSHISSNHTILSASIYWGFDGNGNLIAIHIRRSISS